MLPLEVSTASQAEIALLPYEHSLNVIRQSALFSEEENQSLQACGLLDSPSIKYFEGLGGQLTIIIFARTSLLARIFTYLLN